MGSSITDGSCGMGLYCKKAGTSRTPSGSRRCRHHNTCPAGPTSSKRGSSCSARFSENSANFGLMPSGSSTSFSNADVGWGSPWFMSSTASARFSCPSLTSTSSPRGNHRPAILTSVSSCANAVANLCSRSGPYSSMMSSRLAPPDSVAGSGLSFSAWASSPAANRCCPVSSSSTVMTSNVPTSGFTPVRLDVTLPRFQSRAGKTSSSPAAYVPRGR